MYVLSLIPLFCTDPFVKELTPALTARIARIHQQFLEEEGPSLVPPISESRPVPSPTLPSSLSTTVIDPYREALRTLRAKFVPSVYAARSPPPQHLPRSLLPRDGRSLEADIALCGQIARLDAKQRASVASEMKKSAAKVSVDEKSSQPAVAGSAESDTAASAGTGADVAGVRWEVGEKLDACDTSGRGDEARIVSVLAEERAVRVNFCWSWVEDWIAMDGLRWAPLHTHSHGSAAVRSQAYRYRFEQPVWVFPVLLPHAAAAATAAALGAVPPAPTTDQDSTNVTAPAGLPPGLGWYAGSVLSVDLKIGQLHLQYTRPNEARRTQFYYAPLGSDLVVPAMPQRNETALQPDASSGEWYRPLYVALRAAMCRAYVSAYEASLWHRLVDVQFRRSCLLQDGSILL
jgi:hypothetical protein